VIVEVEISNEDTEHQLITVEAEVSPPISAGVVSDPDANAYSDPGDGGECEILGAYYNETGDSVGVDIVAKITDLAFELAIDKAMEELNDQG
jgi:hypothetical protein